MTKSNEEVPSAPENHILAPLERMTPTRRQILAMATVTCGATVAAAMFKPARADIVAKIGKLFYLDSIVLNFAFEMEELEMDLYSRITRSKGYESLTGQERDIITLMAAQDAEHYQILKEARDAFGYKDAGESETSNSSASRGSRMFHYPNLSSRADVLNTALDVKETVLFGYHGAVGIVRSKKLLYTAAAIAGVEGRHASVLRQVIGLNPFPAPFEGAYGAQHTGSELAKYGFKGGAPR